MILTTSRIVLSTLHFYEQRNNVSLFKIFKTKNQSMAVQKKINIQNKKARFEFEIIDKYVAGIQLTGTEIK